MTKILHFSCIVWNMNLKILKHPKSVQNLSSSCNRFSSSKLTSQSCRWCISFYLCCMIYCLSQTTVQCTYFLNVIDLSYEITFILFCLVDRQPQKTDSEICFIWHSMKYLMCNCKLAGVWCICIDLILPAPLNEIHFGSVY